MQAAEIINGTSLVEEVVALFPTTARVFVGRRMYCVGCEVSRFETVAGAAWIYRQPLEPLLADLRAAADQAVLAEPRSLRWRKDGPRGAA